MKKFYIMSPLVALLLTGCSSSTAPQPTQIQPVNNLQTLKPTNTVPAQTPVKDESASWTIYSNARYGYSFEYPSDMKQSTNSDDVVVELENKDVRIRAEIDDNKLDPKNIGGGYGKVSSLKNVSIGDKTGYQYQEGEGECIGTVTLTSMGNNTLIIRLVSCEGTNNNPISLDQNFINRVLSSFKFKK